ncbi:MAG TPA: XRE family transcriptional regulator [bacterium]|nr:XRE family transcriptional regulator [bacterium]
MKKKRPTLKQAQEIRTMRCDGLRIKDIAEKCGWSISCVSRICRGESHKYG